MTVENWIAFATLLLSIAASIGATFWRVMGLIDKGVAATRAELGATIGKCDLDFEQFKTHVEAIYLRKSEYDIAQRNTDRRLESIECKLDKIPQSLDRQSERLIAALKESRT